MVINHVSKSWEPILQVSVGASWDSKLTYGGPTFLGVLRNWLPKFWGYSASIVLLDDVATDIHESALVYQVIQSDLFIP